MTKHFLLFIFSVIYTLWAWIQNYVQVFNNPPLIHSYMILKLLTAKNKSSLLENFHMFMWQQNITAYGWGKVVYWIYFIIFFHVWCFVVENGKKHDIFFSSMKTNFSWYIFHVNYENFSISPIMKIYLTFVCENGLKIKLNYFSFCWNLTHFLLCEKEKAPFGLIKIIY